MFDGKTDVDMSKKKGLDAGDGHIIAAALESNSAVDSIVIGSQAKPATIPLKQLRENSVEALDFEGKQLLALGGIVLASALRENTSVTVLHVNSNGLDADAGKHFLPIVVKPHFEVFSGIPIKQIRENAVTKLDLKGSDGKQLEACGGIVLAHVLTGNTSVQGLDISANSLGPDGAKAIAASIAENSTITSVRTLFCEIVFGSSLLIPLPLRSLFTPFWVSSSMLNRMVSEPPAPRLSERC